RGRQMRWKALRRMRVRPPRMGASAIATCRSRKSSRSRESQWPTRGVESHRDKRYGWTHRIDAACGKYERDAEVASGRSAVWPVACSSGAECRKDMQIHDDRER